jgi:hypothetical protein
MKLSLVLDSRARPDFFEPDPLPTALPSSSTYERPINPPRHINPKCNVGA